MLIIHLLMKGIQVWANHWLKIVNIVIHVNGNDTWQLQLEVAKINEESLSNCTSTKNS